MVVGLTKAMNLFLVIDRRKKGGVGFGSTRNTEDVGDGFNGFM
jgi:hypothetical protein